MNTRVIITSLFILVFLISCASGGPMRDRIKKRMEARQQVNEIFDEEDQSSSPIALPSGAKLEGNLKYGPDSAQRMDVYIPRNATGPVLFMVHGGAWMVGDKAADAVVKNKVAWLLPQGVVVVSANYRLSPAANPLEQANDVANALAMAQSSARVWGADPKKFVLMGHSAGAHLVSLLASDPDIAKRQGAEAWLGTVALDSAAYDVVEIMKKRHYRFYDRVFKSDPAFWREASPSYRLEGTGFPMMLVCSSRRNDACPQANDYAEKAEAAGRKVTVLPMALSHKAINQNLGLEGELTRKVTSFLKSLGLGLE
ncbi:MAG: alpha/beta hydrolase [Gammaproteobacteria bacterium]|nr:alpha/beta hydrolase [Gammaproteobacteria bacterium]